jgi:hypothetical protein
VAISRGIRLTWTKTKEDGILRSAHNLRSDTSGAIYKAVMDLNNMTYKIINLRNGGVVKEGGEGVNNREVLQRHIKRSLRKLGVPFKYEVRD